MRFSSALDLLEAGQVVRREAWPAGSRLRLAKAFCGSAGGQGAGIGPILTVRHLDSDFGTPWHPASRDLLAHDWEEVG